MSSAKATRSNEAGMPSEPPARLRSAAEQRAPGPSNQLSAPAVRFARRSATSIIHVDKGSPRFAAAARNTSFCSWVTRSSIFAPFDSGFLGFHVAMTIRFLYTVVMAIVQRSYKLRIYPTAVQLGLLAMFFGAARWIWNTCLAWRSHAYKAHGERVSGVDFSRELTWLKRLAPYVWLADVPATVFSQVLRDLDKAFANFFAGRARYPRFKRKQSAQSIRFQLDQRIVAAMFRAGELLRLPGLGMLEVVWSRLPTGIPKMVTIRRDACGRYFISFMIEKAYTFLGVHAHRALAVPKTAFSQEPLAFSRRDLALASAASCCGVAVARGRERGSARGRTANSGQVGAVQRSICSRHWPGSPGEYKHSLHFASMAARKLIAMPPP
jgi:hypothetical protein